MSDQTQDTQVQDETQVNSSVARETLLCRVVDVELSLLNAFRRFAEEEKSSLEDMMNLAREELSKMELFAPKLADDAGEEVTLGNVQQAQ